MGWKPNWKAEEYEYLWENWGSVSVAGIAKHLGRTEAAVRIKAQRLKLGAFLENGDYISLNQLYAALGNSRSTGYKNISWIQNRGLPIKHKRVGEYTFRVISIPDFWEWAYHNLDILDLSRMPTGTFSIEPDWAAEKRRQDEIKRTKVKKTPWTAGEDEYLTFLLKSYKYTTDEIARRLNRTEGAVIRRISTLNLKYRPLRNSPHTPWSEDEIKTVKAMIAKGSNYTAVAAVVSRHSEKAVRGLMGRLYGTERLDKIREILREGV